MLTIFQDHNGRDLISVYIAGFLCRLAKAFPNTRAVEASLVAPILWLLYLADHQGSSWFPLGREHIPFLSVVSISKGPLITHLLPVHQLVRTIRTSVLDVAPDRPLGGAGGILRHFPRATSVSHRHNLRNSEEETRKPLWIFRFLLQPLES